MWYLTKMTRENGISVISCKTGKPNRALPWPAKIKMGVISHSFVKSRLFNYVTSHTTANHYRHTFYWYRAIPVWQIVSCFFISLGKSLSWLARHRTVSILFQGTHYGDNRWWNSGLNSESLWPEPRPEHIEVSICVKLYTIVSIIMLHFKVISKKPGVTYLIGFIAIVHVCISGLDFRFDKS